VWPAGDLRCRAAEGGLPCPRHLVRSTDESWRHEADARNTSRRSNVVRQLVRLF
jgi:hypothetical protein